MEQSEPVPTWGVGISGCYYLIHFATIQAPSYCLENHLFYKPKVNIFCYSLKVSGTSQVLDLHFNLFFFRTFWFSASSFWSSELRRTAYGTISGEDNGLRMPLNVDWLLSSLDATSTEMMLKGRDLLWSIWKPWAVVYSRFSSLQNAATGVIPLAYEALEAVC